MDLILILVIVVLQAIICGILSGSLAEEKGHSSWSWFGTGFIFGIYGLIAAAGLPTRRFRSSDTSDLKKCQDCAEMIKIEAHVCKYCGHRFDK